MPFDTVRSPGSQARTSVGPETGGSDGADREASVGNAVTERIGGDLANLSARIVGMAGEIESLSETLDRQARTMAEIQSAMQALTASNQRVAAAVNTASDAAQAADREVGASNQRLDEMVSAIDALAGDVAQSKDLVDSVLAAVARVEDVASSISAIAKQTNLLALNATIEASRAGEAGKGFAVVAKEVKTLSNQTAEATAQIHETLAEMKTTASRLGAFAESNVNRAETVRAGSQALQQNMTTVAERVRESAARSGEIQAETEHTNQRHGEIEQQVTEASDAVRNTAERVTSYLADLKRIGESSFKLTFDAGADTEDTRRVGYMMGKRDELAAALEAAVDRREIALADLFDEDYRPVPESNPQRYTTRFVELFDRIVPEICEDVFDHHPDVVAFCPADRNGFIPTHNRKWGYPPRDNDPQFNMKYARSRRMFDDPVGLRAARNTDNLVVQAYRRNLGGGEIQDLIEFAAPIYVKGRHWGGFRMNYPKHAGAA